MLRRLTILAAAATAVVLVAAFTYVRIDNPDGEAHVNPTVTDEQLTDASEATVFFAHQSVGVNVVDGIAAVYANHDVPTPAVVDVTDGQTADAGLLHLRIGTNGDPHGKIHAFDAMIRDGLGDDVDVAMLKLCYVDIRDGADIDAIFTDYRDTIAALQHDYPQTSFVAATVPLNTKRDPVATLKGWLGRGDRYGAEHNALREQLNAMIRAEYAGAGALFDIAAIESTAPDGNRSTGRHRGTVYYALDQGYASDHGHLNEAGAVAAAQGFLSVVSEALGK